MTNLSDDNIEKCAKYLHRAYMQCLKRLENLTGPKKDQQKYEYNMVLTKNWMMVVLRKEPSLNGIHCNSLGYSGLLFVKDEEKKREL